MLALKVPSVTVITGEGGSGGALAISCSNKIFMMENSVLYVARYDNFISYTTKKKKKKNSNNNNKKKSILELIVAQTLIEELLDKIL